jgi:tRNA threonylcarbamoyladenosine biosynthesis protein TsaE
MPGPAVRRFALPQLQDTEALAGRLAALAIPRDVLTLSGPLGAGKTAFARGFIRSLGLAEDIPSPTFTLVQTYETPDGREIAHFDLYRLESPDDVWELGWDDALARAITLLEWPERLSGRLLPADRLDIAVGVAPEAESEERHLTATGHGSWAERLARMAEGA